MKKILNIFVSTRTMATLLLLYAFSMAYATFVENDYGTPTAKALIYEAKWFELLMLLLIFNFIANIARYRLWRREKWATLVFHLAFILIFIGGAITRYISYEGQMHIREGETSREVVTDRNYFKIQAEEHGDVQTFQEVPHKLASQDFWLSKILYRPYHAVYRFNDKNIEVTQKAYIQRKKDSLVADAKGTEYLHFVSAGQTGRENFYIKSGETKSINGTLVSYNRPIEGAVEFRNDNGNLMIKTPVDASFMTMATQATGTTKMNEYQPLALRSLYTINDLRIVVPEGLKKGKLIFYEGDKNKDKSVPDLMTVEVKGPKTKQTVELSVEKGNPNAFKQISLDGMNVILGCGPKVITTPFNLKLEKFVMETYPGSSSPSAYESHVQIIDKGKQTPYKIYMNHVLNYDGYRFFQASFDPDRKGTVLSVNHDFWGTLITYIGYALLFLGMFVTFFWKGSHFWKLSKNLKSIYSQKNIVAVLLLLSFGLNAQEIDMHGTDGTHNHAVENNANIQQNAPVTGKPRTISANEIISKNHISEEHAEKFGYLLVQNVEGRIVPMNTQALDVLRKLTKRSDFKGTDGKSYTANQWMLSVLTNAVASKFTSTMPVWAQIPIIKIGDSGGEKLREKAKANEDNFASLLNMMPMDANGNIHYILENDYNNAFRKKPSEQDSYDHEVIAVNERVQIMNELLSGELSRFVPEQNDPNHRWNLWLNDKMEDNGDNITLTLPYFLAVMDATKSGNWTKADAELQKLIDYQQKWGKAVVPAKNKVDLEVFMNKIDLNFKLLIFYTLLGGLLLILGFIELFKPNRTLHKIIKGLIWVGIIGYIFHFLGLIARWYISGHAPWSNGYEAVVFISWVGITAGLFFYFAFDKNSKNPERNLVQKSANALIPASGFMVAVIMMGFAHGASALDPQITQLVPVLKSYWLIVHVAIITASYGFFAMSMIIAVMVLLFFIISSKESYKIHHDTTLKELTMVSEMSLLIGLFLLTIGMFMGGIWANESWGRYWSWDPKETWAFISVMVYAFVVHMRLVPGLRSRWAFHVAAMFAFCSMIMTYFGVNYYLSGLHSYAKGDPVPVPLWVYLGLAFMILLSAVSYFRFKKLTEK